jgi:hypothetical protein
VTWVDRMVEQHATPNPGSPEALKQGCLCPVLDNHHGAGFPWGSTTEPKFWVNSECPIHGRPWSNGASDVCAPEWEAEFDE